MEGIDFVVGLTETQAAVMPPRTRGRVDYHKILYGKEHEFLDWVLDLFEYYYSRAERR